MNQQQRLYCNSRLFIISTRIIAQPKGNMHHHQTIIIVIIIVVVLVGISSSENEATELSATNIVHSPLLSAYYMVGQ